MNHKNEKDQFKNYYNVAIAMTLKTNFFKYRTYTLCVMQLKNYFNSSYYRISILMLKFINNNRDLLRSKQNVCIDIFYISHYFAPTVHS